jgi:hypothetical protein
VLSVNDFSVNFRMGYLLSTIICSFFLLKVIIIFTFQLIDALESHVSTMRATLRRKLIKEGVHSSLIPRAASMAVEVSQSIVSLFTKNHFVCYPFGVSGFWLLLKRLTAKKLQFQFYSHTLCLTPKVHNNSIVIHALADIIQKYITLE